MGCKEEFDCGVLCAGKAHVTAALFVDTSVIPMSSSSVVLCNTEFSSGKNLLHSFHLVHHKRLINSKLLYLFRKVRSILRG